ncbi:amino acid adenylation domain-containing protein [Micromonospora echinospora]|uniref:amino acid adenylation domain-containing protein n=1 Tax=Micromonospora echinospora TaxID=1877 RepID=UPI0037ABB1F5
MTGALLTVVRDRWRSAAGRPDVLAAELADILGRAVDPGDVAACGSPEELVARLSTGAATPAGPPAASGDASMWPATAGQAGIWYLSEFGDARTAYNSPVSLHFPGPLDPGPLRMALEHVVGRHESLRTTFEMRDGRLMQRVASEPRFGFRTAAVASAGEAGKLAAELAAEHLDLADGPLLSALCVDAGPDGTVLLVSVHHAVFDGFSWSVLLGEWLTAYGRLAAGEELPRETAAPQFREAVAALRPAGEADLAYWTEHLAGAPPLLDLPLDRPTGRRGSAAAESVRTELTAPETARLRERAATHGVTPAVALLAAYALLMHRHTGQQDLMVGLPVSLRDRSADQHVIGHLVNTVVLRHRVAPGRTGTELLVATRDEVRAALRHKNVPFERVVETVAPNRAGGRSPLFQTMVTIMPAERRDLRHLGLGSDGWRHVTGAPKYDLALVAEEGADHLGLTFEYDPAVLDHDTVARMAERFRTVLTDLLDDPGRDVREVRWIPEAELRELAGAWPGPVDERPARQSVPELFEARVRDHADRVALESPAGDLTYGQLNAAANRLARVLGRHGARRGTRVAIGLERGPDAVIALLAVLKSGASFVPLDPGYPPERLTLMLRDARPGILLVRGRPPAEVPADTTVVDLAGVELPVDDGDLAERRDPGDEMYVVYTSGSTGRPKGVIINDVTITNLVHRQDDLSGLGGAARTLQYMSISFDVSFMEIFCTLCAGGTVVVPTEEMRTDLRRLADHLRERKVNRVFLPYVALQELATVVTREDVALPDLAEVCTTGEALVVTAQIREMFRRCTPAVLINAYGPSEAHLVSALRLPRDPSSWPERPAIGQVAGNVRAYVLDEERRPVPFGVRGELYVGGPVVGRGYLNLPAQTRERFLPDPYVDEPGARCYRTGDLVTLTVSDGLVHLGRVDEQIKIRGYRIEPGEVEAALNELPGITASAVVAAEHGPGHRHLVAFVCADGGTPVVPDDLRAQLGRALPAYMVPSRFVTLDRLPVAPSGKTDRKALAARAADLPAQREDVGGRPLSETEQRVAAVWAGLLPGAGFGPDTDFFSAGGHSLLAVRLRQALEDEFDVGLALSALLATPSLAGMAARIDDIRAGHDGAAGPDLWADTRLLDGLELRVVRRADPRTARTVLLTGVTGFLGGFLLRALQAAGYEVHCLVRADDEEQGRARVEETCRRYRVGVDLSRVRVVAGDLARERFGLSEADYRDLAGRIEAVYHAAAHINFSAPYVSVRPSNVDGFVRVAEFCADTVLKPLHHMSTLAVFSPAEPARVIDEESVPATAEGLGISYAQSKWVAERLALVARARGVPVTVHRIGRIGPDSTTGACRTDDFFWLQIKSFLQLGVVPDDLGRPVDLLPVDLVADAVVRLARSEQVQNRTVHIFHPTGMDWDTVLTALASAGHRLRTVTAQEWLAALEAAPADPDGSSLASLVPLFREGAMKLGEHRYVNDRTTGDLARLGLEMPTVDPGWITSMLAYFTETGQLAPTPAP